MPPGKANTPRAARAGVAARRSSPPRAPWVVPAVAAALLLLLLMLLPATAPPAAGDARSLPTGGDLHAPFLVSDRTDLQEESHLAAVSDGTAVLAAWEVDGRHLQAAPSEQRLEFCEASFLGASRWSNPFPVSVVEGAVVEGHFLRAAPAQGHFLTTCLHPATNGFIVSVVPDGATFPSRSYLAAPPAGQVYSRATAAAVGAADFAAAFTRDPAFAPPGGQAALVFPLPEGSGPLGAPEVAWSGAGWTLIDTFLVNVSGRLGLLVEYSEAPEGPSQIGIILREGPSAWGPLLPLTAGAADRYHRQVNAASFGGRTVVTFERQRTAQTQASEVVFLEVGAQGSATREVTVSPALTAASHDTPSVSMFEGRATVAWETNDDGLSPGGALASFYRAVDGAQMGPILPLSPAGSPGVNGPPRLVSDGPRLFGLWITNGTGLADGPDLDVVGRYLGDDFDGDGVPDADDPTPAGEHPTDGPPDGGVRAAQPLPLEPVALAAAVGAGLGLAAGAMPGGRRRARAPPRPHGPAGSGPPSEPGAPPAGPRGRR